MSPRPIIQALNNGELTREEAHERMRQILNPRTNNYKPTKGALDTMRGYVKQENRR